MNKIHQLALMGAFALALSTFSCSSDDNDDKDKGNKFLSCSEAEVIYNDCYEQYVVGFIMGGGYEELFDTCLEMCPYDEACFETCMKPAEDIIVECFDSKGFCGSISASDPACEEHYTKECDFIEEDD